MGKSRRSGARTIESWHHEVLAYLLRRVGCWLFRQAVCTLYRAPSWRGKWRRPLGRLAVHAVAPPCFLYQHRWHSPFLAHSFLRCGRMDYHQNIRLTWATDFCIRLLLLLSLQWHTEMAPFSDQRVPMPSDGALPQLHYKVEVGFVACSRYYQKHSQNGR